MDIHIHDGVMVIQPWKRCDVAHPHMCMSLAHGGPLELREREIADWGFGFSVDLHDLHYQKQGTASTRQTQTDRPRSVRSECITDGPLYLALSHGPACVDCVHVRRFSQLTNPQRLAPSGKYVMLASCWRHGHTTTEGLFSINSKAPFSNMLRRNEGNTRVLASGPN